MKGHNFVISGSISHSVFSICHHALVLDKSTIFYVLDSYYRYYLLQPQIALKCILTTTIRCRELRLTHREFEKGVNSIGSRCHLVGWRKTPLPNIDRLRI